MSRRILNLAAAVALCVSGNAWAEIITQNATGTSTGSEGGSAGQSVTTPTGGPWHDIGFNFVQCGNPSGTSCLAGTNSPYALGDLYLLTQVYDGLPSGLSSATPGFVAEATTTVGGVWTFASSVTLNPSTQYFFYMDTALGGAELLYTGGNPYPGGQAYAANTGNGPTYGPDDSTLATVDYVFAVTGTAAATPEPGGLVLLGTGLVGIFIRRFLGKRGGAACGWPRPL